MYAGIRTGAAGNELGVFVDVDAVLVAVAVLPAFLAQRASVSLWASLLDCSVSCPHCMGTAPALMRALIRDLVLQPLVGQTMQTLQDEHLNIKMRHRDLRSALLFGVNALKDGAKYLQSMMALSRSSGSPVLLRLT